MDNVWSACALSHNRRREIAVVGMVDKLDKILKLVWKWRNISDLNISGIYKCHLMATGILLPPRHLAQFICG